MEAQAIAPASRNGTTPPVNQDPRDTITAFVLTPCSRFESKATNIFKLQGIDLKRLSTLQPSHSYPGVNSPTGSEGNLTGRQSCKAIHVAGFYHAFNTYKIQLFRDRLQRGTRQSRRAPFIFNFQGNLLLNRSDQIQYNEDQIDGKIQSQGIEMPSSCKDIRS
jgi:hypothetical protein